MQAGQEEESGIIRSRLDIIIYDDKLLIMITIYYIIQLVQGFNEEKHNDCYFVLCKR